MGDNIYQYTPPNIQDIGYIKQGQKVTLIFVLKIVSVEQLICNLQSNGIPQIPKQQLKQQGELPSHSLNSALLCYINNCQQCHTTILAM